MKKFLLSAFIAVAAMSCKVSSVDDNVNPNEPADLNLTVNVASASAADSRVALEDDGADGYFVKWADGDALGAWGEGLYNNTAFNEFGMAEFGESTSSFSGTIQYGYNATAVRFVYPYTEAAVYALNNTNNVDGDTKNYCNAFDVNIANQDVAVDGSHLADGTYTYMMSETVVLGDDGLNGETVQTPSMKHLGAVLDLSINFTADLTGYKLVSVDVTSEVLPKEVSVNMQTEDFALAVTPKEYGTITLNVVDGEAGKSDYSLPFNIFPFVLESNGTIEIVAHFVKGDESAKIVKVLTNGGSAIDFARAQRHILPVLMDGDLEVAVENKKLTIAASEFGSYNTSPKTKTISGITFKYLQLMKSSDLIQWKSGQGYIFNTDALNGIVSVTFTKGAGSDSSSSWEVTASATEITEKTQGIPVECDDNGVYTFPAGSNYFCVYNNGSGTQKTTDITVEYTGVNDGGSTGGDGGSTGGDGGSTGGDGGSTGGDESATLKIEAMNLDSSYPSNKSYTFGDFEFVLHKVANFGGMQFQSDNGLLYNTDAINGLTEVVMVKSGNANVIVYAGDSAHPKDNAITPTIEGNNYIYSIPSGNEYVSLQNGYGASKYSSITFKYVK